MNELWAVCLIVWTGLSCFALGFLTGKLQERVQWNRVIRHEQPK